MHPFRFGIQCRGPADRAGWADLARKVEDLGWSTLTVADHLDDGLAPVPALMAAADATTTLTVGSMVLANDYRHPVVVAKEAATLDLLSGGRLELGIGAGWTTADYEAAGFRLDRPGLRIARLDESLQVLRGLWAADPCTVEGEHYRVTGLTGTPRPARPGGPRIVVGGGGERILRLAARAADVVAMVTDDRAGVIAELAPGFGLTPDQAEQTPHALIGSVDQICDQLVERRERWGISYLGLSQDQLLPFAPVVSRLAGS